MRALFLVAALATVVACGSDAGTIDKTIGAACAINVDCVHTCFTGADFPGGFCSSGCATDNDCPVGAVCTADHGGVCMYECPPFDCRRLGAAWGCHLVDDSTGGKVNVCIGN